MFENVKRVDDKYCTKEKLKLGALSIVIKFSYGKNIPASHRDIT